MADGTYHDDFFGILEWHVEREVWSRLIPLPPHEDVMLSLPPQYSESSEIRNQIQSVFKVIEQNERDFRLRAADDLYKDDELHLMFWSDPEYFDPIEFIGQMRLEIIEFACFLDPDCPDDLIGLDYTYGNVPFHYMLVRLEADGSY